MTAYGHKETCKCDLCEDSEEAEYEIEVTKREAEKDLASLDAEDAASIREEEIEQLREKKELQEIELDQLREKERLRKEVQDDQEQELKQLREKERLREKELEQLREKERLLQATADTEEPADENDFPPENG